MFDFFTAVSVETARKLSPVTLAFVGDAVYSLYVREKLVLSADYPAGTLQKLTSQQVSAHGQSELIERIFPLFTEEEADAAGTQRNRRKARTQALRNTTAPRGWKPFSATCI